jgi:hypothetical protein
MLYRRTSMRALWVCVLILGCSDRKAGPPVPSPNPAPLHADAAAPDAAAALPADFPAKGAAKASGKLSEVPFSLAKAQLRISGKQASLNLYSWVDGGACDPQFAPDPSQLYISFDMPAATAIASRRSSCSTR